MNKSVITNAVAALLCVAAYFIPSGGGFLFRIGVFALSGGLTNWLAIHMLFERVPLLYGSGVVPNRFEEFKGGMKRLITKEFFSSGNIERFFSNSSLSEGLIDQLNFDEMFNKLKDSILSSRMGSMLAMVGGEKALEPLREPMVKKFKEIAKDVAKKPTNMEGSLALLKENIEAMIDQRLSELSPEEVKVIVQGMIKKHLGWLVVWGGVFGGFIGFLVEVIHWIA